MMFGSRDLQGFGRIWNLLEEFLLKVRWGFWSAKKKCCIWPVVLKEEQSCCQRFRNQSRVLDSSTQVLLGWFKVHWLKGASCSQQIPSSIPGELGFNRRWSLCSKCEKCFGKFLPGLMKLGGFPGSPQRVLEGPRAGSPCFWGKMVWNSLSMTSTIWLWNTMWTVILADSVWGRSNVGPNTMATLWTDILLDSLCSMTLETESRSWINFINYYHHSAALWTPALFSIALGEKVF